MKKGFTLVELLVVIVILGILIALLVPAFQYLFGGEEVIGQVTLRETGQGDYGTVFWIELTEEGGTKITYETTKKIYNKMQMGEWYKVKALGQDKIIKFLEHLQSEPIPPPTNVSPTPVPKEEPTDNSTPQGTAI